ncbi:MAG: LCP family protein [Anaerolineae bacterium]|nr:LCP family protein [Anaerolineae bacterium]
MNQNFRNFLSHNRKVIIYGTGVIFAGLFLGCIAVFTYFGMRLLLPGGDALDWGTQDKPLPQEASELREAFYGENDGRTVCGDQREMYFVAAAIDYRGDDYLYGLADVVRLVRVDFTVPQANVITLPRSLLVNVPTDRIRAENPVLLNQSYFFGTPGMQYYSGSGYGAGSLAETIHYNFGIPADHYLVVDFQGFMQLVDALGGIEVDLPEAVDDMPRSFFPAGKQVLNGEQALQLARIRQKYSDTDRMNNQTIILRGIFNKLRDPAIVLQLPQLVSTLQDSVVTDVSVNEIQSLLCVFQKMDQEQVYYAMPPQDVITTDWVFIPSLQQEMEVLQWGEPFKTWLYQSLWSRE